MKKIISAILISMLFVPAIFMNRAEAFEGSFLKNIYVNSQCKKSDKAQIKAMLKEINKYSNAHDSESIKKYYSKDYISYDGFGHSTLFDMVEKTFELYPGIQYKSKVKDIKISGDFATVETFDKSRAKLVMKTTSIKDGDIAVDTQINGYMETTSQYIGYLKKVNDMWQIYADTVVSEESKIQYGELDKIKISLEVPPAVKKGEFYDVSLNIDMKDNIRGFGSIKREEIVFPMENPDETLREIPSDGLLERSLKANDKDLNEYSIGAASLYEIGFGEENQMQIKKMLGMVFLMKRVNVYSNRNMPQKDVITVDIPKETI